MAVELSTGVASVRVALPNAALILARRVPTAPSVTIHALFRAGAAADPPAAAGTAFLTSSLLDRGTAGWPAEQIAEALDSRGIWLHRGVGRHTCSLACTCLVEDFPAVLGLMSEILRRPRFPQIEVERRRGELLTDIRQDEDTPAVVALQGVLRTLYRAPHPYAEPTKGTVESVGRLDRASLCRFHRERFVPEALSLALAGALDADRMASAAEGVLGDWVGTPGADTPVPPAGHGARRQVAIPLPGKVQADIVYGLVAVSRFDPRYDAFVIANTILGQYGLGGRLGERIRERMGLAYYIDSALEAAPIEAPLVIRAGVDPADVERVVSAIDEEVGRMGQTGITPAELSDAKRYLVGSITRRLETTAGVAAFLQEGELFGFGLEYAAVRRARLRAVTLDEVDAVAAAVLRPERAAIAVAGPPRARTERPLA